MAACSNNSADNHKKVSKYAVQRIKRPGKLRRTAAGESQFVKLQPGTGSGKTGGERTSAGQRKLRKSGPQKYAPQNARVRDQRDNVLVAQGKLI